MQRKACNAQTAERAAVFTPPISLEAFSEQSGLSPASLWRFQKRGWLKTHLISNRRYVLAEDVAEFNRRLAAGEFAGGKQPNPSQYLNRGTGTEVQS